MLQKRMSLVLIGAMTLVTLTACGARRDRGASEAAPTVQTTAPASDSLGAQTEQELDELIATLEAEDTPEELKEFVP